MANKESLDDSTTVFYVGGMSRGLRDDSGSIFSDSLLSGIRRVYSSVYDLRFIFGGWWPKHGEPLFVHSKKRGMDGINISFCNFVFFRDFSMSRNFKRAFRSFVSNHKDLFYRKINVIVTEADNIGFLKISRRIKKIFPLAKVCIIVPDLPGASYANKRFRFFFRMLKKLQARIVYTLTGKVADSFVFFSSFMEPFYHRFNKPFIVEQGIAPCQEPSSKAISSSNYTCVYTGKTDDDLSGTALMISAIHLVKKRYHNTRLLIAGDGTNSRILRGLSSKGEVDFLGRVSFQEAYKLQQSAGVLLMLRKNTAIMRYSCPSKIFAYLSTGNPIVCFRLDSFPNDFSDVLIFPKDESKESVAKSIEYALSLSNEQRKKLREKSLLLCENRSAINVASRIKQLFL